MLAALEANLRTYVNFTEEEFLLLASKLETKEIKKNQWLLREGAICKQVAFLNRGLLRIYYQKEGKEHNSGFFPPGTWVSEYASFLQRRPSLFAIEALEDSQVFLLNYENMQKLYNEAKAFERLGRLIAEHLFFSYFKRNSSLLLESPEERYRNFLQESPSLVARLPLKHIASYVGVEPESLSRIRKRIKNNRPDASLNRG